MVTSGFIGWKRRLKKRQEESGQTYRSGASTLQQRTRKKLTGKEDWFKKEKKRPRDEYDEEDGNRKHKKRKKNQTKEEENRVRFSWG